MIISKEYSNDLPSLTFMESHKEEGFAMLLSDSPITNHNDDDFGRAEFAEHLASYLRQMAKEPTCVVALR